jgi:hypothetical protein
MDITSRFYSDEVGLLVNCGGILTRTKSHLNGHWPGFIDVKSMIILVLTDAISTPPWIFFNCD